MKYWEIVADNLSKAGWSLDFQASAIFVLKCANIVRKVSDFASKVSQTTAIYL
jgi:hypothetical protein